MYLFVQFISYNFPRPVEVCRLKVGDIDLIDKKIYVRTKNKPVKTKIIPDILIKQLTDLSKLNKNDFLFTPNKIGGEWETKENNKRDYFLLFSILQKSLPTFSAFFFVIFLIFDLHFLIPLQSFFK